MTTAAAQAHLRRMGRTAEAEKLGKRTHKPIPGESLEDRWLARWKSFIGPLPQCQERFGVEWYKWSSLINPTRQFQFHEERKFSFDFAWPERKIAVEIQGGTWIRGRHSRGKGQSSDAEKFRLAASLGWRILPFTSDDVTHGRGFTELAKALRGP